MSGRSAMTTTKSRRKVVHPAPLCRLQFPLRSCNRHPPPTQLRMRALRASGIMASDSGYGSVEARERRAGAAKSPSSVLSGSILRWSNQQPTLLTVRQQLPMPKLRSRRGHRLNVRDRGGPGSEPPRLRSPQWLPPLKALPKARQSRLPPSAAERAPGKRRSEPGPTGSYAARLFFCSSHRAGCRRATRNDGGVHRGW